MNQTYSATTAGSYYVVVTSTNCPATSNILTVTVNPNPIITVGGIKIICSGTGTILAASGANTYTWSPATGLSAASGTSVTATPTANQTYTITGTSSAGCVGSITETITVNTAPGIIVPVVAAVPASTGNCSAIVSYPAATVTGTPAPAVTYSALSGTSFNVGLNTVTVTANNSCGTANNSFNVTVTDIESPSFTAPTAINCAA